MKVQEPEMHVEFHVAPSRIVWVVTGIDDVNINCDTMEEAMSEMADEVQEYLHKLADLRKWKTLTGFSDNEDGTSDIEAVEL